MNIYKPVNVFDIDDDNFSAAIDNILEKYKSHPSVLNITIHSGEPNCFSFAEITADNELKLIKCWNINKVMKKTRYHLS